MEVGRWKSQGSNQEVEVRTNPETETEEQRMSIFFETSSRELFTIMSGKLKFQIVPVGVNGLVQNLAHCIGSIRDEALQLRILLPKQRASLLRLERPLHNLLLILAPAR
jgi:hypothetical protein